MGDFIDYQCLIIHESHGAGNFMRVSLLDLNG